MASIENSHETGDRFAGGRMEQRDHQQIQEWNIDGVAIENVAWNGN